jgi:hypothetical protein
MKVWICAAVGVAEPTIVASFGIASVATFCAATW